MKKYKLIKKYPGSPNINTILEFYKDNQNAYCNKSKTIYCPEYYPDNWEEVVEKDYEILSLVTPETNAYWYFDKENNGWTVDEPERAYHSKIPEWCNIHSVKRLSDGEVFTVGDNTNSVGIIESFEITPCNNLCVNGKEVSDDIEYVKHVKKLLFTTEDGVDIFEGDDWYCIDIQDYNYGIYIGGPKNTTNRGLSLSDKNIKRFSTKEAAKEYILMNKPCLSINDILNIQNNHDSKYMYNDTMLNYLIGTVKKIIKL